MIKKERLTFDRVEQEIELPLPEMVFANNLLQIGHEAGFGVRFVAMDALKMVNNREDTLKVADAELWKRTRYFFDCSYIVALFTFSSENRARESITSSSHLIGPIPINTWDRCIIFLMLSLFLSGLYRKKEIFLSAAL